MNFSLHSPVFKDNECIPDRYTCDGADVSPPLQWSGAPTATKSFALFCDDPDAPSGTWHHWAMFDIPAGTSRLDEGVRAQADKMRQGINDFGHVGYGGPCPPNKHGLHRYRFTLMALDCAHLAVDGIATAEHVERLARWHSLADTTLTGVYER